MNDTPYRAETLHILLWKEKPINLIKALTQTGASLAVNVIFTELGLTVTI